MRTAVLGLALFAIGCDRWGPCAPPAEWRVDIRHASTGDAVTTYVRPSTNGELLVLIATPEPVRVGGMTVQGAHLLQVGSDGGILGVASVDVDIGAPASIFFAVTDDGSALVSQGSRVLAYSAELAPMWSYSVPDAPNAYNILFGAAPTGEAAVLSQNAAGMSQLRYLGVDGRERWNVERASLGSIRFDVNADVLVNEGQSAVRYAAADGAVLGTVPSNLGAFYQRDGSSLVVSGVAPDGYMISRFAADGSARWTQTFPRRLAQWNGIDGQGPPAIVGASGDVVFSSVKLPAHTDLERTEVMRLAGDSGDELDTVANCDAFLILAADDDGYIAAGGFGGSPGFARFAWP